MYFTTLDPIIENLDPVSHSYEHLSYHNINFGLY